jgi:hypothetical protein
MKRVMNWMLSGILFGGVAGLAMAGCGEEAEEAYNCAEICETYSDCAGELGGNVDVTECVTSCEDKSDADADFKDDAEACQQCLSATESCVENLPCANECAGVVPEVVL